MIKFDEYWNKVCISSNCEEDEARRHYEAGMMEQNNTMRLSTSPSLCGSEVMRSEFDTLEQYQESMKEFNENTRMGFEEFIQSHGSDRNKLQLRCTPYTSKKGGYGSFDLDFGLCVYQHQQSKVDELKKQLIDQGQRFNEQSQRVKDLEHKNDELQKRVDSSLMAFENLKDEINELHGQCDLHLIKYLEEKAQVLEQALNGDHA